MPRPQISGHVRVGLGVADHLAGGPLPVDGHPPLAGWDMCDLHWPKFREACERGGHPVVDSTGDLRSLQDAFPRWNVWSSDSGRLYAARYLTGPDGPHATTVDAYLVAQLRAEMRAAEATELHHV